MSFFEIFQPGARHQREERDRQNTLISETPAGAAGPLGIDLESGKATFSMPAPTTEEDVDNPDARGDEGSAEEAQGEAGPEQRVTEQDAGH